MTTTDGTTVLRSLYRYLVLLYRPFIVDVCSAPSHKRTTNQGYLVDFEDDGVSSHDDAELGFVPFLLRGSCLVSRFFFFASELVLTLLPIMRNPYGLI